MSKNDVTHLVIVMGRQSHELPCLAICTNLSFRKDEVEMIVNSELRSWAAIVMWRSCLHVHKWLPRSLVGHDLAQPAELAIMKG